MMEVQLSTSIGQTSLCCPHEVRAVSLPDVRRQIRALGRHLVSYVIDEISIRLARPHVVTTTVRSSQPLQLLVDPAHERSLGLVVLERLPLRPRRTANDDRNLRPPGPDLPEVPPTRAPERLHEPPEVVGILDVHDRRPYLGELPAHPPSSDRRQGELRGAVVLRVDLHLLPLPEISVTLVLLRLARLGLLDRRTIRRPERLARLHGKPLLLRLREHLELTSLGAREHLSGPRDRRPSRAARMDSRALRRDGRTRRRGRAASRRLRHRGNHRGGTAARTGLPR